MVIRSELPSSSGNGLFCLQQKLREVKALIKEWTASKGSDAKKIATAREELDTLVKKLNTSSLSADMEVKNLR